MDEVRGTTLDRWSDRYAERTHGMRRRRSAPCSPSPAGPRSSRSPAACRTSTALPLDAVGPGGARLVADARRARPCSTAPARATRRCASRSCDGHGDRGHRARTPTTSSSPPAPSRRSTWSPGSSSTRATSWSPRRPATSARSGCSAPTRPTSCTSRSTPTGSIPDALDRTLTALRAAGRTREVALHRARTSTTRPASRSRVERRPQRARDRPPPRRAGARGQPVRAARLRRRAAAGAALARRRGRRLPRLVLQDVRARATASAGRSRRTPCARSSCWPASRRSCARRSFSQIAISPYLASHDWRHQIKLYRELYRERRDAMVAALAEHLPEATWTVPRRRLLRVGAAPRGSRRQGDAAARRHRPGRLRARAPRSTPTARGGRTAPAAVVLLPHAGAHPSRACGGSPAWSTPSCELLETFGARRACTLRAATRRSVLRTGSRVSAAARSRS